jgi:hypothetical protein
VGQVVTLQGLSLASRPDPHSAPLRMHAGRDGNAGRSIDPDLSTSTITFGLNFLTTMGVLLSSWEMESGATGTKS